LLVLSAPAHASVPTFNEVFIARKDEFKSIRIPAILTTRLGTVLAFSEGRAANADQARNKILLKRSGDGGRTWSAARVIAADGDNSLNNPCCVQERDSSRIFLMYQRVPANLKETSPNIATGYDGPDVYRCFLISSDDDGLTWSPPLDITRSVKRPTGATTICSGPGIGIQLTRGVRTGRLIIPFNEGPYGRWNNYAVFSDDRGKTWAYGQNVPGAMSGSRSQVNEVQMVELSDGSVMLNSRHMASRAVRKIAISHDGGMTWPPVRDEPALRDPSVMASIFRYSFDGGPGGKGILLFSGPDSDKRRNGTIHMSYDDGQTWPVHQVLFPGNFGYSVLTCLPDGKIGCLFESGGKIVFSRFTIGWLAGVPPDTMEQ